MSLFDAFNGDFLAMLPQVRAFSGGTVVFLCVLDPETGCAAHPCERITRGCALIDACYSIGVMRQGIELR
jgi:hypothetical protein